MSSKNITPPANIKKIHVEAAVAFAIENIPGTDTDTLQKLIELVNVTGNFGAIPQAELLDKMHIIQKFIPNTCGFSLYILAELLDIGITQPATNSNPNHALTTYPNETAFLAQLNIQKEAVSVRQ
jgi:hypothetical protein